MHDAENECRFICLKECSKTKQQECTHEPSMGWKTEVASEAKISPKLGTTSLPDVVPKCEVMPRRDVAPGLGVPSTKKLASTPDTRLCALPDVNITGGHDVNQTNHMAPKQPMAQEEDEQLTVKDITRTVSHIASYATNGTITPSVTAGIEYRRNIQANVVDTDTSNQTCPGTRTNNWVLHDRYCQQ